MDDHAPCPPSPLICSFFATLPGRLVSAVVIVQGQLWLIMDPAKSGTTAPARSLVVDLINNALS